MAATAGYRPARGPWRISAARNCELAGNAVLLSATWSSGSGQARFAPTSSGRALFPYNGLTRPRGPGVFVNYERRVRFS